MIPTSWTKMNDGSYIDNTGGFYIVDQNLYVIVENNDFIVASGELDHLKAMARDYMMYLDAVYEDQGIDGPDIIIYPETKEYALPKDNSWGNRRNLAELIQID